MGENPAAAGSDGTRAERLPDKCTCGFRQATCFVCSPPAGVAGLSTRLSQPIHAASDWAALSKADQPSLGAHRSPWPIVHVLTIHTWVTSSGRSGGSEGIGALGRMRVSATTNGAVVKPGRSTKRDARRRPRS